MKKRRKIADERKYTCESELCEQLVTVARSFGFKVYAETGGHDLLLVAGDACKGFKEGDQIGIQAKLKDNIHVLSQALPRRGIYGQGPHYYAVLVPTASTEFVSVARACEITVLSGGALNDLYVTNPFHGYRVHWYRQTPAKLCWVPECEVHGLKAGVAAPVQITQWKMAAIKLCMVGVERGYLTTRDFKEHGIDMGRWLAKGWIKGYDFIVHEGKRMKRYILVDEKKPPHLLYGVVTDALGKAGLV